MSNGNFSTGQTVPLAIPSSIRREWERTGVTGADLIEAEAEYADAQGYVFEWGQILEELTDRDACHKPDDPDGPGVQWHFVLTDLHHEFCDAGGNLGELADYCLALLDGFLEDAGIERALGDGLPEFLSLQDGNSISGRTSEQIKELLLICGLDGEDIDERDQPVALGDRDHKRVCGADR